ncbi:MAG: c-type cytochrome [Planctomycetota bacterium]
MRALLLLLVTAVLVGVFARAQDRTAKGREVFLGEACWQCHTHARDASLARVEGTRRTGPVIGAPGPARSRGWQRAHFFAPRATASDSPMPAYATYFTPHPRIEEVAAFVARYDTHDGSMHEDGIVTQVEYTRAGGRDWEATLGRLDTGNGVISRADSQPVPTPELEALIDYLAREERPEPPAPVRAASPSSTPADRKRSIARGRALFLRHCAGCHGESADGNGPAAPFFGDHPPRNFLRGEYRYRSTTLPDPPLDEDLFRTIRRGAGPSMPAWPAFADRQVWDLVEYLKSNHPGYLPHELFVERDGHPVLAFVQVDAEVDDASGFTLGDGRLQKRDGRWWWNGRPVQSGASVGGYVFRLGKPVFDWMEDFAPEPVELPDVPIGYSRRSALVGARVYREFGCGECHGADGRGDGPAAGGQGGSLGQIVPPADYTRGPRWLKGGADARSIVRTFLTGLHGTPMPAYGGNFGAARSAPPAEAPWHLAHFVMRQAGVPLPGGR